MPSWPLHIFVKLAVVGATMLHVLIPPGASGKPESYVLWLVLLLVLYLINGIDWLFLLSVSCVWFLIAVLITLAQGVLYQPLEISPSEIIVFRLQHPLSLAISLSATGLRMGLVTALKILSIVFAGQLLTARTTIEEFAYGLRRLHIPFTASTVLILAMRLMPLVKRQWSEILDARRLRGVDLDHIHWAAKMFRVYPASLVALVLALFRRGLDLEISLLTRGFYIHGPKTILYDYRLSARDYVLLALLPISLVVSRWINIIG